MVTEDENAYNDPRGFSIQPLKGQEETVDSQLEGLYQEIKEIAKILEKEMKEIMDWLNERYNNEAESYFPSLKVKVEIPDATEYEPEVKKKRGRPKANGEGSSVKKRGRPAKVKVPKEEPDFVAEEHWQEDVQSDISGDDDYKDKDFVPVKTELEENVDLDEYDPNDYDSSDNDNDEEDESYDPSGKKKEKAKKLKVEDVEESGEVLDLMETDDLFTDLRPDIKLEEGDADLFNDSGEKVKRKKRKRKPLSEADRKKLSDAHRGTRAPYKTKKTRRIEQMKEAGEFGPWDRDEDIKIDGKFAFPTEDDPKSSHCTLGCKLCKFKTRMVHQLTEHMKRHERIAEVREGIFYFCHWCDFATGDKEKKTRHVKEDHAKDIAICDAENCGKKVPLVYLQTHQQKYHAEFVLRRKMLHENAIIDNRGRISWQDLNDNNEEQVCAVCGWEVPDAFRLLSHYRTMGKLHKPECFRCGETYRSWKEHQDHVLLKHNDVWKWRCGMCYNDMVIFDDKAEWTKHYCKTHRSNKKKYEKACEHCGMMMESNKYQRHLRLKHGINKNLKVNCKLCTYVCKTDAALKKHMERNHTQFDCDICGLKTISGISGLHAHQAVAHGIGPAAKISCEICAKTFSSKASYKFHMYTHTGEKPYECEHCHQKFADKSNMRNHVKQVHLGQKRHQISRPRH